LDQSFSQVKANSDNLIYFLITKVIIMNVDPSKFKGGPNTFSLYLDAF